MKLVKRTLLVVFSMMTILLMSVSANAAFTVTNKQISYPTQLAVGSTFTIKGSFTSNITIKKVTASIYNSANTKAVQTYSANINAKTYDLSKFDTKLKFDELSKGTYYYRIEVTNTNGKVAKILEKKFTVVSGTMTIKKDNITIPGTLTKGKTFAIKGTVSASATIKCIVLSIYDSKGTTCKQKYTAAVNAKTYDISKASGKLKFETLDVGTYYYRISIYNTSGKKYRIVDRTFTVKAASSSTATTTTTSSIKISNPVPAKAITITKGTSYGIGGTITSANKLIAVKAEILDSSKNVKYTKTVNPGATTYKLSGSVLDSAMYFDKLAVGTYSFVVSAKDSAGKTAVLINRSFFVTAQGSKVTISNPAPASDITISKGSAYGISGAIKSTYKITKITAVLSNSSGKSVYTSTATSVNSFTYSLGGSKIDNELLFNKLSAGTYYLNILVTDDQKSVFPVISRKIVVK